jgi:hypothetical protein
VGVANPPQAGGDGEQGEIADCTVEAHRPQWNEASVASAEGRVGGGSQTASACRRMNRTADKTRCPIEIWTLNNPGQIQKARVHLCKGTLPLTQVRHRIAANGRGQIHTVREEDGRGRYQFQRPAASREDIWCDRISMPPWVGETKPEPAAACRAGDVADATAPLLDRDAAKI